MTTATVPTMNRQARILPAGKDNKASQFWTPLVTAAGVLVNTERRTLIAGILARLMDAHMRSNPLATFGCVGHGIRAVTDAKSGAGSPFFIEAKGASVGEILLFNAANRDALRAALGDAKEGGACVSIRAGGESKGPNTYVVLAPDADADKVYSLLQVHASHRGNIGWLDMGAPADLEGAQYVAPPATEKVTTEKVGKDPSAPKSKRAAKRDAKVQGKVDTEQAAS